MNEGNQDNEHNIDYLEAPGNFAIKDSSFSMAQKKKDFLGGSRIEPKDKNTINLNQRNNEIIPSDKATLQRDLRSLADDTLSSQEYPLTAQEEKNDIAQRENIYDEKGNIIDVRFSQNGKVVILKSVLPGTYRIEFIKEKDTQSSYAGKDEVGEKVIVYYTDSDSPREINLTLLHEAGHIVDNHKNESVYHTLEKELLIAEAASTLALIRSFSLMDSNVSFTDKVSEFRLDLQQENSFYTFEEFEEIKQNFEKNAEQLSKVTSEEEASRLYKENMQIFNKVEARKKSLKERGAWTLALYALKQLRRHGVNVYNGTKDDLFTSIDNCLLAYQYKYREYLTPTTRFVKRSQPQK